MVSTSQILDAELLYLYRDCFHYFILENSLTCTYNYIFYSNYLIWLWWIFYTDDLIFDFM